jgi:hypothetical protein
VVNAQLTQASGTAERETALALLGQPKERVTLAADRLMTRMASWLSCENDA